MAILTANGSGHIAGQLTVPANVVAGKKRVEFIGNGGTRGEAIYTGSNILINEVKFKEIATQPQVDPLAQTFTLAAQAMLTGVDLWFSANGTSPVIVQIRNTNNGVPGQDILCESRLAASARNTTTYTRFAFPYPMLLESGVEYAMVIQCNDAVSALKIATLGQYDAEHTKWVTAQPYQIGVLLSSSNASTWTPHQISDLAFRLLSPAFNQNAINVDLGYITATAISDLMVLGNTYIPSVDTNINFTLTLVADSNRQIICTLNQIVHLPALYTGQVNISANLTGTATRSPVLGEDVMLATGVIATSGTYITRLFPANAGTNVTVIIDAYTVGSATVAVHVRTSGDTVWTAAPLISTAAMADGFAEITYKLTGFSETDTRIKITLTGTTAYRPFVRKLRVALT